MRLHRIPRTDLAVSRIAYGCAELGGAWEAPQVSAETIDKAIRAVNAACDSGITLFDHADVYSGGKSEAVFGEVLRRSPGLREKIILQSKCGIHHSQPLANPPPTDPHRTDLSFEHIVESVEGSLRRLATDRLDILLLHRPDALMEPEEVAKAFDALHGSGKVRYFGVSNHTPAQIELLQSCVRQPLVVNQIWVGLTRPDFILDGLHEVKPERLEHLEKGAGGTLDYCRLHKIQVQAFSPLRGLFNPEYVRPEIRPALQLLAQMAQEKQTSPAALALAWLLRHPAGIIPIIGAINPKHITESCAADRITVSRQEWYALLLRRAP